MYYVLRSRDWQSNSRRNQNRLLREETTRLKQVEQAYARLKSEIEKTLERQVLLEENK